MNKSTVAIFEEQHNILKRVQLSIQEKHHVKVQLPEILSVLIPLDENEIIKKIEEVFLGLDEK